MVEIQRIFQGTGVAFATSFVHAVYRLTWSRVDAECLHSVHDRLSRFEMLVLKTCPHSVTWMKKLGIDPGNHHSFKAPWEYLSLLPALNEQNMK